LKPPSSLEFLLTFLEVGMDIFWNYKIDMSHTVLSKFEFFTQFKIMSLGDEGNTHGMKKLVSKLYIISFS